MNDLGETRYVFRYKYFHSSPQNILRAGFCNAFWDFLQAESLTGCILSIDKVSDEIVCGGDALASWFQAHFQSQCVTTQTPHILDAYQRLVRYVEASPTYKQKAKDEFMKFANADAWLLAYCLHWDGQGQDICLVTAETYNPEAKKRVPIPNICRDFNLVYCNCFDLIRNLKFTF